MTNDPGYPVVLRPLAPEDGGGWIALVPDLPGCMSDGENADEALHNVREAIEEWKDAAARLGRPVPEPDDSLDRSFETDVPEEIRRQAEAVAESLHERRSCIGARHHLAMDAHRRTSGASRAEPHLTAAFVGWVKRSADPTSLREILKP